MYLYYKICVFFLILKSLNLLISIYNVQCYRENTVSNPSHLNSHESISFIQLPGQKIFDAIKKSNLRSGTADLLAAGSQVMFPDNCVEAKAFTGYTNSELDEDDFGFEPLCDHTNEFNTISCFPGTATVITPNGVMNMEDIQIGTLVATDLKITQDKGKAIANYMFNPVVTFLHRLPYETRHNLITVYWNDNMNNIQKTNFFMLSSYHLIPICNDLLLNSETHDLSSCQYIASKRVKVGDKIIVFKNQQNNQYKPLSSVISSVKTVVLIHVEYNNDHIGKNINNLNEKKNIGLYAPVTLKGTLIVNNILVSQYSTLPFLNASYDNKIHYIAHRILWPILALVKLYPSMSQNIQFLFYILSRWGDKFNNSLAISLLPLFKISI